MPKPRGRRATLTQGGGPGLSRCVCSEDDERARDYGGAGKGAGREVRARDVQSRGRGFSCDGEEGCVWGKGGRMQVG